MIILSLDPGFDRTGYAVFDKKKVYSDNFRYITSGLIKTDVKSSKSARLSVIYHKLNELIRKFRPETIIIEDIFFFKNQKTVVGVSQAQGVILLTAALSNITVKSLSPLVIKQRVTGYGFSDKKGIKKMVDLQLPLKNKKIGDDEYDAIACGLAYCFQNDKLLQ